MFINDHFPMNKTRCWQGQNRSLIIKTTTKLCFVFVDETGLKCYPTFYPVSLWSKEINLLTWNSKSSWVFAPTKSVFEAHTHLDATLVAAVFGLCRCFLIHFLFGQWTELSSRLRWLAVHVRLRWRVMFGRRCDRMNGVMWECSSRRRFVATARSRLLCGLNSLKLRHAQTRGMRGVSYVVNILPTRLDRAAFLLWDSFPAEVQCDYQRLKEKFEAFEQNQFTKSLQKFNDFSATKTGLKHFELSLMKTKLKL